MWPLISKSKQVVHKSFSEWQRYGIAVLSVAIALKLTLLLNSVLHDNHTLLFLAAIALSSGYGGMKPGLVATILSTCLINYFFLEKSASDNFINTNEILLLIIFVGIALSIVFTNAARQQAREAMRERELKFSALSDVALEGIVIQEMGKIIDANPSFARIFGYELDEVIGKIASDFVTAESFDAMMQNMRSGDDKPYEITGIRKDGTTFSLEIIGRNCTDRGRAVRVSSVWDISERKQAEQVWREREQLFSATFNQAAVGIAHVGIDGKWLEVNQKLYQILGYTHEELLKLTFQEITHPDDLDADLEYVRQLLADEIQTYSLEKRYLRQDGSSIWINLTASLIRNDRGEPKYFISVVEDIDQRKQAEEELKVRARQQETIADLGQQALSGIDLSTLMDKTVRAIAQTLNTEYCKILELLPKTEELGEEPEKLLLRSGVGWQPGLVGQATVDAGINSQAGYTLLVKEPVVVTDLRTETRFNGPPLLHAHGVISGLSVIIAGRDRPWGVLGTHSTRHRTFTKDDIHFFQAAANILAEAIERQRVEAQRTEILALEQAARLKAQANEQYYRFLAESIPQLVWTAKPNGEVDYYSQRWCEYTGLTAEQIQLEGWQATVYPDDLPKCSEIWQNAVQTGCPFQIEARVKRANGKYSWMLGLAVPMRDSSGQIVKWFGTNTDIEEQKQAQEERTRLLEREQVTRKLAEAATDMVQRLQAVSDVALNHLSLEELLQESLNRISEVLQADSAAILLMEEQSNSLVLRAAKGLEKELKNELHVPIGEGFAGRMALQRQPIVIEQNAYRQVYSPILQKQKIQSLMGAPLLVNDRVLGVVRVGTLDIRQFTLDDLRLLQLVADRIALAIDRANSYEAEQKARQEAETANRIKDEFLAVVSHELRTPLNSILGWAQMLRTRKMNEATVHKALETIERNAKQQVTLIEDILDVSRIIRGKIRLSIQPVYLDSAIEEAIETIKPELEAKSIQLEMNIDPRVGAVIGDRSRLLQVVSNLLSNAAKFTPEAGKIEVSLLLEDCRNDRSVVSRAQITVSDTGKGISPDFLPHVFEGFRQEDSSITRSHGGLGLGLTIVRRLVELHGGTVNAFSEGEGKGATFTIFLPLMVQNQQHQLVSPASKQEELLNNLWAIDGLNVLVVDDDRDTCDLIATVLAQYGAEVTTVNTAFEAINAIEKLKPDVLLSDIGMPEEDGYALIRKVRELEVERGGQIRAIALTAFARDEDRRKAIQAGFHMHVPKPVEPAKLATVVANLIGQT
ncbi:MAG TPA: PAS domain S-box protein [Leptolyngbyaceae cyanobacterium]